MTKDELKYVKEQQKKVEESYKTQISYLNALLDRKDEIIKDLEAKLDKSEYVELERRYRELERAYAQLEAQLEHLKSGLTGEEIEYYSSGL